MKNYTLAFLLTFLLGLFFGRMLLLNGVSMSEEAVIAWSWSSPGPQWSFLFRSHEVILTDTSSVERFSQTIHALPPLPYGTPCTANLVMPIYTLSFYDGMDKTLVVTADRSGCGTVAIQGEHQVREASSTFWTLLERAISSPLTF